MKTFLKKILILCAIILAVNVVVNLRPSGEAAATCDNFMGLTTWDCNTSDWNGETALKQNILIIIFNIITDLTVLASYLVIGFVIYGGYFYILAQGEPAKIASGKKILTRAFIGLAIVLLSSVIMNTIRVAILGDSGHSISDCANQNCIASTDIFVNAISFVIGIGGLVSLIFIFIGGIGYLTSSGDPTKLTKAKHTILYACIGLAIVAISLSLTAAITSIIEGAKDTSYQRIESTSISRTYNIEQEQNEILS